MPSFPSKANVNDSSVGYSIALRCGRGDASFDCVVVTDTLCSVPDPVTALKEMRRVLKTDGPFFFCEHGLAPDESVRRWQDRLTPYWKNIAGGCHLNRDIAALISEAVRVPGPADHVPARPPTLDL